MLMEQVKYDKSGVCQVPPALIKASGKWYQKPWASIMSLSVQTKAASLQFTIAVLYLLIGVVSSYAIRIMHIILYADDGTYWMFCRWATELTTFAVVTILPLVMCVVALMFSYGFLIDSKKSLPMAVFLNLIGLITLVPTIQVLEQVSYTYSYLNNGGGWFQRVNSYVSIWGILFWLVPLSIILIFTMIIYLGFSSGPRSMTSVQDSKSNELQQSKGIGRYVNGTSKV